MTIPEPDVSVTEEADGEEPTTTPPRVRLANVAVGTAMIATDQVRDGVRSARVKAVSVATEFVGKARGRTDQTAAKVRTAVGEADQRGRDSIETRRRGVTGLMDSAVGGMVGWAQVNVMPRLVDGLVPHLISDVVPRLIDGALPEIQARVVPVLIDDLTSDPRVRELILAQSRGVLGQVTEQVRTGATRADDRLEVAARRMFGRADKESNAGKSAHDSRGA